MPYPKTTEVDAVEKDGKRVETHEQLTYVITKTLLREWLEHPSFETFIQLRKNYFLAPHKNPELMGIKRGTRFTEDDIMAASQLCYEEFMRRIGTRYLEKAKKRTDRTDLYIKLGALFGDENMTPFKI